jgi:hypothetical protein
MNKMENFKSRLVYAIALGKTSQNTFRTEGRGLKTYDYGSFVEFRSSSLSFLKDLFGESHPYYIEFNTKCNYSSVTEISAGLGVLRSVGVEINNGWLDTVRGIVSAEVFSDFLEMADHLLKEHYKDAAAVMIGSVLEEHLRQLCHSNSIDTYNIKDGKRAHKRADSLNVELGKTNVYNMIDQKQVLAWLDLRNKAAHGSYGEYSEEQVSLMYQGVLGFIARNQV